VTNFVDPFVLLAAFASVGVAFPYLPRVFAPLAFLPVGKPVTLPVPARAVAALTAGENVSVTYRSRWPNTLSLEQIPGAAMVERDDCRLHFFAEHRSVVVAKRSLRAVLVRVDVAPVDGALVLRARELPQWVVAVPLLLFAFERLLEAIPRGHVTPSLVSSIFMCGFVCFAGFVSFVNGMYFAQRGVDAVVAELKKRLDESAGSPLAATL
jgi:hypothetical protein